MNRPQLFIFLYISLFSLFLSKAEEAPNPVLDINGTIVEEHLKYYVVHQDPNVAGLGFNLFSLGSENQCPKSVFQAEPYYWGCLIVFHPVNPDRGVIREWTNLNIEIIFDKYTPPCPKPNFWKINNGDPSSQYSLTESAKQNETDGVTHHYITTGGESSNPNSWFKIVKTENSYKFMYCPSICDHCRAVCQDVGISEAYENRLVLSDTPFEFAFRRPETLLVNELATPVPLDELFDDIAPSNYDFINQLGIN